VPGLIATKRGAASGLKTAHLHDPLLQRRGTSEDVAAAVRYLCGPAARSITGQELHVNAGAYLR
jgi:3-oxoacyl-[acyl-carrier protein] reductase